ncbi:MAG: hypothetical protein ACREQK_18675 [Candidatus Binatia bacterium]
MKKGIVGRLLLLAAVVSHAGLSSLHAADAAFYKGKTVTVLINYAAGGPTDIEGRLVARFLPKHVPGNPTMIVQNMPGAGGVVATNYLAEVAKPDGLAMGYFTQQFFNVLTADPNLRVDLAKFGYVAGIEGVSVAYIRKDVQPGINEPRDILKAQNLKAGGLSLNSSKDVRLRLQLDILGVPYQYVTGYNSNSDARLAVERNEIQFFTEGSPAYRSQVQPRMVKTGVVIPVYADDLIGPDGEAYASAEVSDIASFSQLYQQVSNKPQAGPLWAALRVVNLGHAMQRLAALPPGAPAEAMAALKQGFASMVKDAEFIQEFKRVTRSEPRYTFGNEAERLTKQIMAAPAEARATIRKYTQSK